MSKMKKPDLTVQTHNTAMHEAAHAVVALTFGSSIFAQVVDGGDTLGFTDHEALKDHAQTAIVSLAGYVVEVEHLKMSVKTATRHAEYDFDRVDEIAREVSDSIGGRKAFKSQIMRTAQALVAKHMPQIEKIADMLMTGEEVSVTVDEFKKMM